MSIKLIASDIDGTLLPKGGSVSEATRAAVRACAENGILFAIATGRWYVSARDIVDKLGQTEGVMIIANGGAVVRLDGAPIQEWGMSDADVATVYGILKQENVMINAFVRNGIYRINTKALNCPVPGMSGFWGDDYRVINDDIEAFEREGLKNPYKMEAYSEDEALLARIRVKLVEAGLSVSSSFSQNLEIMSMGMGKGAAIRWLAGHIGATCDECMACGDMTNDLSMLEAVGWPVAVGNAADEVKAAARIIAPRCEDDGVAQIIMQAIGGEIG